MKRAICLLSAIVLMLSLPALAAARAYILDPADVEASAFTDLPALAAALEEIFAGDIDLFEDEAMEKEVILPLGTSMSTSEWYYLPKGESFLIGKQCFAYANAVYQKLFGEPVGRGTLLENSEILLTGGDTLSFEMLSQAGIKCGAYMRTTEKEDGSYDGYSGHSLIILYYDAESITYLEGNADNKGLVRITVESWTEFERQLSGKGRYLCHIVCPTDQRFEELYGIPDLYCAAGHLVERFWETVSAPTVGAEGEQQIRCAECGEVMESRALPALADAALIFEDIGKKDWFYKNDAVNYVFSKGIFKGVSDTLFAPDLPMTRGMLVTVLGRMRGIDENYGKENTFTDVNARQYYAPYVSWAAETGLVNGFEDGSFRPDDPVTREQMSKIIALFCALDTDVTADPFADEAQIGKWARPYVHACRAAELLQGRVTEKGTVFDPTAGATRAEIATIIYRMNMT